MRNIKYRQRQARQALRAAGQQAAEALAEQRALGKPRERLEVRQEVDGVLLVEILQREGQVGSHLLQQEQLVRPNDITPPTEQESPDRRVVDPQWQAGEGLNPRGYELVPSIDNVGEALDVLAEHGNACAHDASHETRIAALLIRDRKLLLRLLEKLVARPGDRARHACRRIDQGHHRQRVAADAVCQPASLSHDLIPVLDAHQRRVDSRQHL